MGFPYTFTINANGLQPIACELNISSNGTMWVNFTRGLEKGARWVKNWELVDSSDLLTENEQQQVNAHLQRLGKIRAFI